MSKNESQMYVITHKKLEMKTVKNETLLLVGSFNKNKSDFKGYLMDDSGQNISEKNKNYCELTGLYWIWKNSKKNIIGLEHYRRFFSKNKYYAYFLRKKLTDRYICKCLKKYDIILPNEVCYNCTNEDYYKEFHIIDDMIKVRTIISSEFPDYLTSYDKVMHNNKLSLFNMFITSRELLNEYCNWLFKIFELLEPLITDLNERDSYQQRIYGFISERLLNVWVNYKKLKIKHLYVYNSEVKLIDILKKRIRKK